MGTFKEFIEKLQSDREFADNVNEALAAKQETGDTEAIRDLISVAEDCGYSVTEEEIKVFKEQQKEQMEVLSEEEMGKVSGGTSLITTILTVVFRSKANKLREKVVETIKSDEWQFPVVW